MNAAWRVRRRTPAPRARGCRPQCLEAACRCAPRLVSQHRAFGGDEQFPGEAPDTSPLATAGSSRVLGAVPAAVLSVLSQALKKNRCVCQPVALERSPRGYPAGRRRRNTRSGLSVTLINMEPGVFCHIQRVSRVFASRPSHIHPHALSFCLPYHDAGHPSQTLSATRVAPLEYCARRE